MKPFLFANLVSLLCSPLLLVSCGGDQPSPATPAKVRSAPEPKPEPRTLDCALAEPSEDTLYLAGSANGEWKRKFEAQREQGSLLLVKKEGETVTAVDCRLSGKYVYSVRPEKRLECVTDDAARVKSRLPAWLTELGGSLPSGTCAAYEGRLIGQWSLDGSSSSCPGELEACSGATHVVERIDVGAYASYTAPRDLYESDSKVSLLFAPGEGPSPWTSKVENLAQDGQYSNCEPNATNRAEPPPTCAAPVVVKLKPLATMRDRIYRGSPKTTSLSLHASTPSMATYGVNGPDEMARLNLVKMCDPEFQNCVTPDAVRSPELPPGTLYATAPQSLRCGGIFSVEGEYWVESNTFREPGLKLCAIGTGSTNPQHCTEFTAFKRTNVNQKSNWRKEPWPKFKVETRVPASGNFAAVLVLADAGNFGLYLRNLTFVAR